MIFEAKDAAAAQKAGITTLLDLALLLPKSFDDLSVGDAPCTGESTAEVECLFQHRRGSMLIVTAHCLSWEREIKIVIFNAKSWHFGAFKRGKKFFIHGKCDESFGSWQFVNPKIVSEVGRIAPKYKAALSDAAAQKLIKKYLSAGALLACGLRADEAAVLLALHESSPRSVRMLAALNRQLKEGGAENFGERDDVSNSGKIPSVSEILSDEISSSNKILNCHVISDNSEIPSSQSSVAAEILNGRSQNDEILGNEISNYPQSSGALACEARRGAANEILSDGIPNGAEASPSQNIHSGEAVSDKILDGEEPQARGAEICNDENFSAQGDEDLLVVYGAEAREDEISDDLKANNDAAVSGDKISNDLVSGTQAAQLADVQTATVQPMLEHVATKQSIAEQAAQQNLSTQDIYTQFAIIQTLNAQATGVQPVCDQTENVQAVVAVQTATAKPTIAQNASAEAVQDALAAPMSASRDCAVQPTHYQTETIQTTAAQATTAIPTIAQIASDAGTVHAAEAVRAIAVAEMSGAEILRTLKFVEILNYLQKLSAKKTSFPAQIYPLHDISDWLASLPFEPTHDQLSAIKDIASDLQSPLARRRVVMGDVGSGKTLVILASAAMNYPRIS